MSPGLSWFSVRQMRALRTAGPLIQLLGAIKMTVFNLAGYTAAQLSPLYYIRLTQQLQSEHAASLSAYGQKPSGGTPFPAIIQPTHPAPASAVIFF